MLHGFSGTEDRRAEKGKDREGREGGEGDGDKGKGAKKRRKSSSGMQQISYIHMAWVQVPGWTYLILHTEFEFTCKILYFV